jgi:hypothetical protein
MDFITLSLILKMPSVVTFLLSTTPLIGSSGGHVFVGLYLPVLLEMEVMFTHNQFNIVSNVFI